VLLVLRGALCESRPGSEVLDVGYWISDIGYWIVQYSAHGYSIVWCGMVWYGIVWYEWYGGMDE